MNERARRQMEEDLGTDLCEELHHGMTCEAWAGIIGQALVQDVAAWSDITTASGTLTEEQFRSAFEALRQREAQVFREVYGGPQVNLMNWLSDDAQYVMTRNAREQMDEIDRIIEGAKEGSG